MSRAQPNDTTDETIVWTVRVQQAQEAGGETNTYTLPAGEAPHVVSTSDRELWVQRTNPGTNVFTLVAVHARDMWVRCWIESEWPDG